VTGARHDLPAGTSYADLAVGEYGKDADGRWIVRTPDGRLGDVSKHSVTEHEDGTITVSPSILVSGGDPAKHSAPSWHGFLEAGVWRSA
jgi:hypothetical protein